MALDDAIGGDAPDFNPQSAIDDLINRQGGTAAGTSASPDLLANRLYRKLNAPKRPTNLKPAESDDEDEGKPDFSSHGVSVDKLPDFSSEGTPAPPPGEPPAPQVSLGATGQAKAALKGIPHAAIEQTGSVMKGAAIPINQAQPYLSSLQYDPEGNVVGQTPVGPTPPIAQHPLYRAGQAVQDFADRAIPMTDQEKASIGGRIGQGIGGVAPYLAAGAINPALGVAAGGIGMAASSAADTFDAAIKKGASEEDAASAAGYSALVGGALGALPLGMVLKPIRIASPLFAGRAAGYLEEAVKSGLTFATVGEAQEYLLQKIAKEYYDPQAGYSPDAKRVIASLLTGGVLGAGGHFMERRAQAAMGVEPDTGSTPPPAGAAPAATGGQPGGGPGPGAAAPGAGPAGGPSGGPGAGPSPGGAPPPRPEAERSGVGRDKLEKILRYFGFDDATIKGMSHAEMADAVLKGMKESGPKSKPSDTSSTQEEQSKQGSSTEQQQWDTLTRYGWTSYELKAMTPVQRRRAFSDAMETGRSGRPNGQEKYDSAGTTKGKPGGISDLEFPQTAVQQPESGGIQELRRSRDQGGTGVRSEFSGVSERSGEASSSAPDVGPKGQQQGLRAGKPSLGDLDEPNSQSAQHEVGDTQRSINDRFESGGTLRNELQNAENAAANNGRRAGSISTISGTREAPITPRTADDVVAAQPAEPSPAQAAAENYQHAHVELPQLGLEGSRSISIETGVGQERKGVDADGKPWSVKLTHAAYGRIKGTQGADGQPLDIFVGPHPTSPHVFVIDQHHPGGGFDEHKVLAGFRTPIDALHAYAHSYNDQGKDRIGHVTAMGPQDFQTWLDGDTTKPLRKEEPASLGPVKTKEAGPELSTEATVTSPGVPKESPTGGGNADRSDRIIPNSGKSAARKPTQELQNSVNEQPSLLQFIASRGGLEPHPELQAIALAGDHRVQIPGRKGFFGVLRPTGMKLDAMREAAEEAGYLKGEHNKTSTIRHLLDAIDGELRGQKLHAEGEEGSTTKREHGSAKERSDAARDKAVAAAREDITAEYEDLPEGLLDRAAEIMADERLDLDTAVEMAAIRTVNEDPDYGVTEDDIRHAFGKDAIDEIQPRPTPDHGGPASEQLRKEQGPGEGKEAGGHEPRVSGHGEAGREQPPAGSVEETAAGQQSVIPDAEKIGEGQQAQRKANQPLKPKVPQKPVEGLFGDERNQGDLLDHMKTVDRMLGADAERVAPVDIARAAELMADNPGMEPATAFGQAVIKNAVEQGLLTQQEAVKAYGEEVTEILDTGREGASGGGAPVEQGSTALEQERAGGAAQNGELPGRSEGAGESGTHPEAAAVPADEGTAAASGELAAGRRKSARNETGNAAENSASPEDAGSVSSQTEEPTNGVPRAVSSSHAPTGTEDVQPVEPGGQAHGVRGREGEAGERVVPGADEGRAEGEGRLPEGAVRKRGAGSGDADADRLSEPRADDETGRREKRATERAANLVEGDNHVIEPGSLEEDRGQKAKAFANLDALELANKIVAEDRPATAAEQQILAKYVGWGGIKNAFPDTEGKYPDASYQRLGDRLKELLPDEEYATARRSIQYAHYTSEPIVRSMWDAVARLGFDGGQVFEPGMGVGNFAGMMPADIADRSHYTGVELDHTTARIAKLLYPKYGVRQDDFTKMALPENAFDLVIGNPPFADVPIKSDPKYKQGFLLHDYFFAKSIDAVRPCGLLAFVTSAGTMNKMDPAAREYLADRADLVGAIRLPGDAFKKNAGTEVTTDIVFMRKRLPADVAADRGWTETRPAMLKNNHGNDISGNVSSYFLDHPEQVLGEEGFFDKLYQNRYAVRARPGADLKADLAAAIERLPQDVMSDWQNVKQDSAEHDFTTTEKKEGTFYVGPNGELHQVNAGVGIPIRQRGKGVEGGRTAAEIDRIKGLVPVRDALREVYASDLAGDTGNAQRAREALNRHYDAFVDKFGPINKAVIQTRRPSVIQMEAERQQAREDARYAGARFREGTFDDRALVEQGASLSVIARERQNARTSMGEGFDEGDFDPTEVPDNIIDKRPNVDAFMDDPESYRLRAIERYDEGTGKGHKSPVFSENIITREKAPEIKSTNDALLYSLSKFGRVNLPEMATLLKKSPSEVVEALGDQVFAVPGARDTYETRDEYLSGNVRKKLTLAKKAAERNPSLRRNVDALEAAQPIPLAPSQIHASLGMPWIPPAHVEEFGTKELGLDKLTVKYLKPLAQWIVSGDTDSVSASSTWGTPDRRAPALIEDALNRKNTKIYDKVMVDGKENSVLNIAKTEAAQDKIKAIQEKFANWIWADQDRADKLAGMYNEKYNNLVVWDYDGFYLTTPGISSSWRWRPHQKRVIARIIQSGNTYVAHAVGGGKTSEYIGAIMEMRRLGLVRKPMVTVPNHMLAQFTKEWYEQYPMAKLAVADERRFHTDRRKQFIANVANDDLDAIVITHSAFGMIPVSDKFQNGLVQGEIDQYRALLGQLSGQDNRITRSRVEKQIERLEQRLVGRSNRRRDQVFNFEEMGVDHLTVDEAHLFRKLDFATQMSNLKGVSPEGSGMAWDLYTKAQYLDRVRPGRSLVMGSGTPITNTMAELYTVQRFMQPQELAERGIEKFDAWAGAFGESVSELEQDAAGNYKPVSRFAKFVNVAELSSMVRQFMDVVTSKQLEQYVTRPQIAGGKRTMHLAEKSPELEMFQDSLARRMEAIQKRKGPPQKGDDIMLSVINDGRHAAIDMRLAGGTKSSKVPSKLDMMVDNVFNIWKESKRQAFHRPAEAGGYEKKPAFSGPATQLMFINLGLSGARGFSVPDYIRSELARRGVPKNEIAYIYDYKSATAKQRLFNDMNEGKVRILMGSVAKMGVGTNVQKRLLAIHNQDPLWYPADDEQRNGRGVRQGNLNPEIGIHDYSTKGTYDSTMWGMMAKKAKFIQGFFEGDPSLREMDDLGEASQYEQAKALTTNDPRLIRFTELKQELERAQRRKTAFDSEVYATRQNRANAKSSIEHYSQRVQDTEADIVQSVDTKGDAFKAKLGKDSYDERPAFGDALMERMSDLMENGVKGAAVKIGEIGGFPIHTMLKKSWLREGDHWHPEVWLQTNGKDQSRDVTSESPRGMVQSMENVVRGLPDDLKEYEARLAKARKFYAESEAKANAKFAGQAEIAKLTAEVRDMEEQLKGKEPIKAKVESGRLLAKQLTPEERTSIEEVVRRALKKMLGEHVNFNGLEDEGIPLPESARAAWGELAKGNVFARGLYRPWYKLIHLALTDDLHGSIAHEAYHAIEYQLQTPAERKLMEQETPRLREYLQRSRPGYSAAEIASMADEEVRANAFEDYAKARAKGDPEAGRGVHIGVRAWWNKLLELLRQIKNGLTGMGFKTYRDIFGKAYEGGYADASGDTPREGVGKGLEEEPTSAAIFRQRGEDLIHTRLKELMKSTVSDRFVERYQNLSEPVKRLQEAVEAKMNGTLPDSQAFYTKKRLFPGKVGATVQDFNKAYLDPIIEVAKQARLSLPDVGDILYALHAPERNRAMEEINHPALDGSDAAYIGKRSGMSNAEARAILARHPPALVAEIDRLAGRIRDYNLALQVHFGLLSQAQAHSYEAKYDHYVPLSGWDVAPEDQPEQYTGTGNFNVRGAETKRAFGRKTKADNPLVNLLDQSYRSIERAKKNEYDQALNSALSALDNAETKGFVRFDKGKPKKIIDPMTGLVREVEDPFYRNEPGAVGFKVGGNQRYVIFEDKELGEAIKRMHADGLGMFQPMLDIQNKLKSLWTHYSPDFLFRHFAFRYPIEGTLNSFEQKEDGNHSVGNYIKNAVPFLGPASKAIFAENRGSTTATGETAEMQRYWRAMRNAGGSMTFRSMRDTDLLREHLTAKLNSLNKSPLQTVKDKHQAAVEAMDTVTNALDNSLRLAAFASAKRQGKTDEQAALIARDATVDFQLAGKWKNAIGLWFPFGNVAIQTGIRMTSAVARSKIMRRVFMGTMLAGFLAGAFNYLVGGDDKDGVPFFDKIPEWDRHLNFIVMGPPDSNGRPVPIKIPLPYNWAFPFTIGSAMATMAFGKNKHKIRDMLAMTTKAGVEVATPFGQEANVAAMLAPELARPVIHVATNKDWAGRPVHANPDFQKGPNAYSARKTTGDGWNYIAQGANTATGGDKRHSGMLDMYPEDYRLLFDYVGGTQRRLLENIMQSGQSVAKGESPDLIHLPLARVVAGTDYEAADRSRRYERENENKRPWQR